MKSVLIVDDEADINLSLKVTLEENSFEVNTFDDPIVALDNFKRGKIDSQVKVCFLTAGEMYYGAYAAIFNENQFIRKPIENKELINRVNEIINS
jgi:two-component SAPR family response regulator